MVKVGASIISYNTLNEGINVILKRFVVIHHRLFHKQIRGKVEAQNLSINNSTA